MEKSAVRLQTSHPPVNALLSFRTLIRPTLPSSLRTAVPPQPGRFVRILPWVACGMFPLLEMQSAAPLPNAGVLPDSGDRSTELLEGAHRFAGRLQEQALQNRAKSWTPDFSSPGAYVRSLDGKRMRLREILGIREDRLPPFWRPIGPSLGDQRQFSQVRWDVLEGLHGEGIRVTGDAEAQAALIFLPDTGTAPEQVLGRTGDAVRERLLSFPGEIWIPRLLNRECTFSGSDTLNIWTNCSHREWIYRQAFILGKHPAGMEVQKILALVETLLHDVPSRSIVLAGEGEGAWLALLAAALEPRVHAALLSGAFGPRESLSAEPLDHNLFGFLQEFGDAELAALIAPRPLVVRHAAFSPEERPVVPKSARAVAAPGRLPRPAVSAVEAEVQRAAGLAGRLAPVWSPVFVADPSSTDALKALHSDFAKKTAARVRTPEPSAGELSRHQRETVREMEAYCQNLIPALEKMRTEATRRMLADGAPARFYADLEQRRERFWEQSIGRLREPFEALQTRAKLIRETETVTVYEVEITVWKDVPAWGWLCIPKGIPSGQRRPVVVCQHGLEGLPEHVFETDETTHAWRAYKAFALRLAEQGFVTFAPHNLYRGKDLFRSLQRRLNPLGLSLYSLINGQHERILEWLGTLPFADPGRIAFYGLSYGGKTAMRTPSVLPGYCLSICSGDFNEWIRKCASISLPMGYVFVGEHEIWEWNLAGHANYAEMAALIAPRPFMVERGHRDGVGSDEWVNYEFAKVRRLYNQLGLGDRVAIEHFDGPHTIHGVGTFEFLRKHLQFSSRP